MAARDEVVTFTYKIVGDDQVAATAVTLVKTGTAAEGASAEVVKLSDSLKTAASQASLIEKALSQKTGLADLTAQLKDAQAGLDKLKTEFDQTDTSSKKVTKAFADAEKAVASLTAQQTAASVALQKTEGALQKAGVDTADLGKAFQKVQADGNAAATSLAAIGTAGAKAATSTKDAAVSTKQLGDEANRSGNLLTVVADNLGKIITVAAAVKLALKGITFAGDAFEGASKVEDQLARVQAVAEATQETFVKFGPAVSAAAEEVNVSTDQAAKALAALVQQGQSADQALQSLVPTLRLAKIAQIDVAQAAALVDDALDRFGLSTADAGDVVDTFVVAAKGAKDGLAGIAGAMQGIAPLARELGLGFKDVAGILGLLQQNGIDAGSAVRGLRTLFTELQDPASKLRLNLSALGDSGSDFATAIDTIANSGEKGRKTLLDLDGQSRVLATFLVQQGAGAIGKFSAALDQASGAADRTIKAINATAGGAFDALTHSLDRAAEELAQPFLEPIRVELQKLADELSAFAKTKDFQEIKADLTALAHDAAEALDKLIHGLKWEDLKNDAKGAVSGLTDDFHSLATNVDTVTSAISKLVAAITILKNIGDIGGDLAKTAFGGTTAAALEAALAVSKARDAIKGSVSDTTTALQDLVDKAAALAKGGLKDLKTDAGEAADAVGKLGTAAARVDFGRVESGAASTARAVDDIGTGAGQAIPKVEQLAVSLGKVADAPRKAIPSVAGLSDALVRLGKTQEDLTKVSDQAGKDLDAIFSGFLAGSGKLDDVRAAFAKYQESLRASTANSDEWQKQTTEDILSVKAAALGISDTFQRVGDTKIPAPNVAPVKQAFQEIQQAVTGAGAALAQEQQDSEASAARITGALGNALSAQAAFLTQFAGSSQKAVDLFTKVTREFFEGEGNFSTAAITDSTGIIRFGEAIAQAGALVQHSIDQQRQGVADLAAQYAGMSDDALRALAATKGGADQLQNSLAGDAAAARAGRSAFDLLGAADLSGLASALDAASQKLEQIKQQAQQAKDALSSIGDALKDEIDQLRGNQTDIENRRFQNQIDQIKEEAKLAGTLNSTETIKVLHDAELLHKLKLQQIKEQADAQKKADDAANKDKGGGGGAPNAPNAPNPTPAPTQPQPRAGTGVVINAVLLSGDKKAADDFVRFVKNGLAALDSRS